MNSTSEFSESDGIESSSDVKKSINIGSSGE